MWLPVDRKRGDAALRRDERHILKPRSRLHPYAIGDDAPLQTAAGVDYDVVPENGPIDDGGWIDAHATAGKDGRAAAERRGRAQIVRRRPDVPERCVADASSHGSRLSADQIVVNPADRFHRLAVT